MKTTTQNLIRRIATLSLLGSVLAAGSTAMAADAVVKKNSLTFNGKKYFRVGSEDVELGSYGEKKTPLLGGNYLEVQDRIPAPKLKVKQATIVSIDFKKSKKVDILANVNLVGVFKGSSSTAYQDLKAGRLKLVKLTILNNDIRDAANQSPKVLDDLISYGNDARMCHQVFVVLEATLASRFTASKTFDVSVNAGAIKIEAKGGVGAKGSTTVTISRGSVFAYSLVKLEWNSKKKKKKKTRITKVTDDQHGLN